MQPVCKLCKEEKDLQVSHVIPKLLYRYMRRYQDKIQDLKGLLTINSHGKSIDITQRQWTSPLFCKECEGIFSKNETIFARIFHEINALQKSEINRVFYCSDMEAIITEMSENGTASPAEIQEVASQSFLTQEKVDALVYFSASFVLRQLYIIENILGEQELNGLEQFVLGKNPENFSLTVKVNNTKNFKLVCSTIPFDRLDNFKHYIFIVPEMAFHLIFDINGTMGNRRVAMMPDDLFEDETIRKILRQQYEQASPTKKADLYIKSPHRNFPPDFPK